MRIKKTRGLIDKSLLLKMIVTRARGCGQGWKEDRYVILNKDEYDDKNTENINEDVGEKYNGNVDDEVEDSNQGSK